MLRIVAPLDCATAFPGCGFGCGTAKGSAPSATAFVKMSTMKGAVQSGKKIKNSIVGFMMDKQGKMKSIWQGEH